MQIVKNGKNEVKVPVRWYFVKPGIISEKRDMVFEGKIFRRVAEDEIGKPASPNFILIRSLQFANGKDLNLDERAVKIAG